MVLKSKGAGGNQHLNQIKNIHSINYHEALKGCLDFLQNQGAAPSNPRVISFSDDIVRYHIEGHKKGSKNGAVIIFKYPIVVLWYQNHKNGDTGT